MMAAFLQLAEKKQAIIWFVSSRQRRRIPEKMVKQKYLDKAEVLIEALPYIQKFNRKIIVVKYGGSA